MFENNARGIVHINGELITDNYSLSAPGRFYSPKRITQWVQGGMVPGYSLSGGGVFEILALRRALTGNEVENFQNYVVQKYNILPDIEPPVSSQDFIGSTSIKKLLTGNQEVKKVFVDKKINYFFRRYQTMASFGSGSNIGSTLLTENDPLWGMSPAPGTYQTNDFIYFEDVYTAGGNYPWGVLFNTPFVSYTDGLFDVNRYGVVMDKSTASNVNSLSIPQFEFGNVGGGYEVSSILGDYNKIGYEKNIIELNTNTTNLPPDYRMDYFYYMGSTSFFEIERPQYRIYELVRFLL
jgi:hypothetical protein